MKKSWNFRRSWKEELNSQNEDEERCRSLDLAIRRQQMARREAAAAQAEGKQGKKHRKNR